MSADDVFVSFVESARRMLCESFQRELPRECDVGRLQPHEPCWSWVCMRILTCCKAYPSGVTSAILLSELYEAWLERERSDRWGKMKTDIRSNESYKLRKQRQLLGVKVTSIDSILERKSVSLEAVLDVIILDIQLLPGTTTYVLTLGDAWSFNTIELYLHTKFYDLLDGTYGILRKSREIRLTGCRLRNALSWDSGPLRLLPTEYVIILLDEDQDDDLVLLGAKFCNDYFSSIQLNNVKTGAEYNFYARVEDIGVIVVGQQDQQEDVKQQRITLRDDNGDTLPLVLWNDQVYLSKLISKGSMVAIERPLIAYKLETDNCTVSAIWFEYESQTRLYTVPNVTLAEQVTMDEIQLRNDTSGLCALEPALEFSGVEKHQNSTLEAALPRDSQGSLNFVHFPFRIVIDNVRSKMSSVALYGLVTYLSRAPDMDLVAKHNFEAYKSAYLLRIGDCTGVLDIKLYFNDQWSAGEIRPGEMIFICGIMTSVGLDGRLECIWTEKHGGVSLVNMTQLPALLSTSCLHRVVPLSKISSSSLSVQVCKVRIGGLVQHGVLVKYCHIYCGHPVTSQSIPGLWSCNFCRRSCDAKETVATYFMTLLLMDTYPGHKTQVYATCSGQAAREILQAGPEDFFSWSEIDQGMYLYSLENEKFLVTLYSGLQDDMGVFQTAGGSFNGNSGTCLRIGQARKADSDRVDN